MKVLVCGGRYFNDAQLLNKVLMSFETASVGPISEIVHGDARGADTLAAQWAQDHGKIETPFPADWEKHGKAAGVIRNAEMLLQTQPHCIIAFPGGNGTADMVKRAKKAGYRVFTVNPMDWAHLQ